MIEENFVLKICIKFSATYNFREQMETPLIILEIILSKIEGV